MSLMAACGIDCGKCDAYIATQTSNAKLAQEVAVKWGKAFGDGTPFPVEATVCDGCRTEPGRHGGYCQQCPVRACAAERKVETCAHCDDYGCEKIEGFLKMAGAELRGKLEGIRRSLGR